MSGGGVGGRCDASTSTDDVKSRPLCLFYFTHPFGVLSPEPPTLAAAPAHIARAFVNMEPVSPYTVWGATDDGEAYNTTTSSSRPDLVSVSRARKCTLELSGARRDSLSSSLFSSDMWFNSGSSCKSTDYSRRLVPYNKILPPLRLPSPRDSSNLDSSDDLWPKKCINPEKFSLPPIELPAVKVNIVRSKKCSRSTLSEEQCGGSTRAPRRLGVSKPRRPSRPADLRRLLAALMRRAIAEGGSSGGASPALRHALATIREAWAEPRSLNARCGALVGARVTCSRVRMENAGLARPGASPGLLRRRYSVPETIMRKYRLAQQRSDSEESVPATSRSAASASPVPGDGGLRYAKRDRELMRRSALMRRMWGRAECRGCCCCADEPTARETRSLDGSRSELASSRYSHAAPGWTGPKRQRIDSRDFRGSDEMLRAAMRNSYDRAEESRDRTYRSHVRHPDSCADTATDHFTDSDASKCDERRATDACTQYSDRHSSDTATVEIKSAAADDPAAPDDRDEPAPCPLSDERSFSDTSDTFSVSLCTAKEMLRPTRLRPADVLTGSAHVNGRISEHSASVDRTLPYDKPLTIDTAPSYELLEIVVSETLNADPGAAIQASTHAPEMTVTNTPSSSQRSLQNINIDEYVSNILVESLNSLTDQLECMNASIASDRRISIVEKEIKVKLQNTGVNTIVHLSPTSNNQIIFGNEELCNDERQRDACNNALTIREETLSVESNNNGPSVESPSCPCDSFDIHHDSVNQAVLQQIQKLFQDELHNNMAPIEFPAVSLPGVSHVEVSDVDTYIDNAEAELAARESPCRGEVIGAVGAGNYFPDVSDNPVVPRFSALPHTDSMEVNTSSSEDADFIGSDCTSLVDSLDDPNSPRSVLLRRAYGGRRGDLVRSAIDVLDLLPENARNEDSSPPRDKPESFFIGIKDSQCDCDKENVNVADSMPEKIKQRLYRRHRKRELRMECARRTRTRQQRRELERERDKLSESGRSRRDVERDCIAIVNALIDDVIAKIAQDEYKCMRIKHRPNRTLAAKSEDNVVKRTWRKELEPLDDRPFKSIKNGPVRFDTKDRVERHQVHGKLSLRAPSTDDRTAKRIYQKSEIHDGNKCIEILEILEYVNGSQSSPDTTNSDENQNLCTKNKKSRIPVPIYERSQKSSNGDALTNNNKRSPARVARGAEQNGNTNRLIADMLLEALGERDRSPPPRRASVPVTTERAPSLRFRQVFDIIPEERSSLSLDSGAEELAHARRASAPDLVDEYREPSDRECDAVPPPRPIRHRAAETLRRAKDTKSAATSPMSDVDPDKRALRSRHQTTMTSPNSKSAATSPLRTRPWQAPRTEGITEKAIEPDRVQARCSVSTQHDVRWARASLSDRADRAERALRPERAQHSDRAERLERAVRAKRDEHSERALRAERTEHAERHERAERAMGARAPPSHRPSLARSQSCDRVAPHAADKLCSARTHHATTLTERHKTNDKRKNRTFSLERSEDESTRSGKVPEFKGGGSGEGGAAGTSSDSSESGGLLCALAPRWLAPGRSRRAHRRVPAPPAPRGPPAQPLHDASDAPGGWSVTVAGSCRAALPADVEMRLRFPHEHDAFQPAPRPCQECTCRHCVACSCLARGPPPLPPPAPPPLARADSKLTLTMKKEALDSSILASKSTRKSSAQLPDVETYRAARTKLKSSVKTRRGYSLHCWLPDTEVAPIRARNGLSVLGCAIIPELKPRVPTMSERDLTRVYTPRHYLRS